MECMCSLWTGPPHRVEVLCMGVMQTFGYSPSKDNVLLDRINLRGLAPPLVYTLVFLAATLKSSKVRIVLSGHFIAEKGVVRLLQNDR